MNQKERLHEIHYALSHFSHLLSENERVALGAIAFNVVKGGQVSCEFVLKGGIDPNTEVRQLLAGGMPALRHQLADRLLSEHRALIYENACKKCGQLPATPRAKQCLSCGHSWRVGPGLA